MGPEVATGDGPGRIDWPWSGPIIWYVAIPGALPKIEDG